MVCSDILYFIYENLFIYPAYVPSVTRVNLLITLLVNFIELFEKQYFEK